MARPGASERIAVALACAASLAFNLGTGTRFPIPWLDEVMFTDPAANLVLGNGFTSSAWFRQTRTEFWAGYPPLYPAVLSLWIRAFGLTPLGVRSLDYVLIVVAAALLWLAVVRLDLIASAGSRLTFVALVLLGYGPTFCQRSGRVDCLGIVLCAGILLAYSIDDTRQRRLAIAVLAMLLPLAGLQLAAYAALMAAILCVLLWRTVLVECIAAGIGVVAGAAALYVLYSAHGVWDAFTAATVGARSFAGRGGIAATLRQYNWGFGGFYKDPSFVALLVVGVAVGVIRLLGGTLRWHTPLTFGLVVAFVVPIALFLTGVYPVYYSWMAYVPLCIGLCWAASRAPEATSSDAAQPQIAAVSRSPRASGASVFDGALLRTGLVAACVLGMPLISVWSARDWRERDYARVETWLRDAVTGDDWVYLDYPAYYAVKPRAAAVFTDRYLKLLTPAESERVTALIVSPAQLDPVVRVLGGRWRQVGAALTSRKGDDSGISIWGPRYDLALYRRDESATSPTDGDGE